QSMITGPSADHKQKRRSRGPPLQRPLSLRLTQLFSFEILFPFRILNLTLDGCMYQPVIAVTVEIDEEAVVPAGLVRKPVVVPFFKWFLSHRGGVALDIVGLAISDVDAAAIGFPAIGTVYQRG